MDILRKYFSRLLKIWYAWVAFFLAVLEIIDVCIRAFVLGFSLPWWVPALLVVFGVVLFFLANLQVFRESEAEIQRLESYIDEIEDTRANIRFKPGKYWSNFPSYSPAESPFPDLKLELNQHTGLDENGLPGWAVIGAWFKGEKKSSEPGVLVWKIVEVDLPPIFAIDEGNEGSFLWGGGLAPLDKIKDWRDDFDATFKLPIRIVERDNPRLFARKMRTLGSYRIVINYHTLRGIDSESKSHPLVLEGDFQEFRDQLCKIWKDWGLAELAELAGCQ